MRKWMIGGAALLVACAPPQAAAPQADSIDGRYVVTAIDGRPPMINIAGYDPTITITGSRVHFQSQCIYADWTLERLEGSLSAKPYYKPGSGMCARGLAPGETAIQDAFTGLTALGTTPHGGLRVEGGRHVLELRRAPPEKAPSLVGSWRVQSVDGRRPVPPIQLEGDASRLWWEPACALQVRSYTVAASRFDAPAIDTSGREVCDIAYPQALEEVWRIVEAADTIEAAGSGGVRLSGGGRSLTLVPR